MKSFDVYYRMYWLSLRKIDSIWMDAELTDYGIGEVLFMVSLRPLLWI
jgi:hypothetical protein